VAVWANRSRGVFGSDYLFHVMEVSDLSLPNIGNRGVSGSWFYELIELINAKQETYFRHNAIKSIVMATE
jgi:hypothetical protein